MFWQPDGGVSGGGGGGGQCAAVDGSPLLSTLNEGLEEGKGGVLHSHTEDRVKNGKMVGEIFTSGDGVNSLVESSPRRDAMDSLRTVSGATR